MWGQLRKDFEKLSELNDIYAKKQAVRQAREAKKNPPPPKKPRPTLEDMHAEYATLRRRIIDSIADNYILDVKGRETYKRTASAYAVVGKYKVNATFIDYDHDLRDINTMAAGIERNRTLKALAKKMGIRS